MDYVRWMFSLDFCTPRYLTMKELLMDKLRVGWRIRAKRFEHKIKRGRKFNKVGKKRRRIIEEMYIGRLISL